jgi:putative ubiquitin-RnfH superfamily antitoxin RatB of RatAB toxin-antitoxin module
MAAEDTIEVEVVFALPEHQELIPVTIASGSTAADAIEASAVAGKFPDQDLSSCQLGIWGRLVDKDQPLQDRDRVEIYRPLKIDPREARRKLAAEGKSMGGHEEEQQ